MFLDSRFTSCSASGVMGKRAPCAVMCTSMCGGGERQRACPRFHRALLPCNRCWWLWYVWCAFWWECWWGGSYCSGELMSSRGPLCILDGSMDPHCACGFCSRWFFSMDFSPSVKHMQAPWVLCPSVWTCSLLKNICTAAPAGPLWAESGLHFTKEGFLEAF